VPDLTDLDSTLEQAAPGSLEVGDDEIDIAEWADGGVGESLPYLDRAAGARRKGSLALADGRLYLRAESGTMILIEPNREKYIERGRFEQPERTREQAWTHPVIANGKLYVRDQDTLFCYDVKKK
jgi:outer membrane protein assembly factor BamB